MDLTALLERLVITAHIAKAMCYPLVGAQHTVYFAQNAYPCRGCQIATNIVHTFVNNNYLCELHICENHSPIVNLLGAEHAYKVTKMIGVSVVGLGPVKHTNTGICCACGARANYFAVYNKLDYRLCGSCVEYSTYEIAAQRELTKQDILSRIVLAQFGRQLNRDVWSYVYRVWMDSVNFARLIIEEELG